MSKLGDKMKNASKDAIEVRKLAHRTLESDPNSEKEGTIPEGQEILGECEINGVKGPIIGYRLNMEDDQIEEDGQR